MRLPSGDLLLLPLEKNPEKDGFCLYAYRVRPKRPDFIGSYYFYAPEEDTLAAAREMVDWSSVPNKQPFFSKIEIRKEFRGKGIAQILTDESLAKIAQDDLLHVVQFQFPYGVSRMKPKYERLGYTSMTLNENVWIDTGNARLKSWIEDNPHRKYGLHEQLGYSPNRHEDVQYDKLMRDITLLFDVTTKEDDLPIPCRDWMFRA